MKAIKLDKKDFSRALLTDTFPADVPVIFGNDGLYINGHIVNKSLVGLKETVITDLYKAFVRPELIMTLNDADRG
ncbi:hypothetical protein [Shewanella algae]|uniref:hypothetical protein n=1 Tax=Shewanella algae TaxID=38313 RepID=UPI001BF0E1C3|nr:hypothetical protein [Shewanella algae]BCV28933.1 hypothetical protein TUM3811_27930 [Shewanella algae]